MKLLKFPLIKFTACVIIGIIVAHVFDFPIQYTLFSTTVLIGSLLIVTLYERNQLDKSLSFGILTIMTFIGIGVATYQLHDQKHFSRHYLHHPDLYKNPNNTIKFQVKEVLKPSNFQDKYIVNIIKIDTYRVTGKALLNIKKDSLQPLLQVDDILLTSAALSEVNDALNPYQFDYRTFLQKQYIYHQLYADYEQTIILQSQQQTIFGFAAQLRNQVNNKLKYYHFETDERALVNALLLGQRQDINSEIYDSYSKAGAVHILAISGLHVGIILLFLNWLFKPLEYLRHGKLIKTVLIVLILWSFAIIAGLSASVTRAVAMFSIVAIGMNLNRPANIFNTLAISMFFLLLFKPLFLFDVGFQMSYLAVIAIVSFQPIFVLLWHPKWWPIEKLWQIFTVTLAAQLGVVPISLFYFHQFPGLFFLSNLVIIPFLGIILGLGIIVIVFALLNILPFWLANLYGSLIELMNNFVRWIALQERFVVTDIPFGWLQVLTTYLVIIALFFLFNKLNYKRLAFVMLSILLFQSALIIENKHQRHSELIVFHKNRKSMIGLKQQRTLTIGSHINTTSALGDPVIRNYKIGHSIQKLHFDSLQNLYDFHNLKLLVVDSMGIYIIPGLQPDYVLLRNSPKINLHRLLDSIKPKHVIADGSNYKSYLLRWEQTCIKHKTPYHLTSREGAFVLKSNID